MGAEAQRSKQQITPKPAAHRLRNGCQHRGAPVDHPGIAGRARAQSACGDKPHTRLKHPRVARAYLIGEAADDFAATLGDTPHVIARDMATAVALASEDAAKAGGDAVVLLSPACASFDQFPDFEARGEAFRAAVLNLGATPFVQG